MRIDIITVVPGLLESPFQYSIVARAIKKGLVEIHVHDLREYGLGSRKTVDDYSYGGDAGMVMMVEPVFNLIRDLKAERDYDEVIYTLTIKVSSKDGKVVLDVSYTDKSGSSVDTPVFTNVFDDPPRTPSKGPKTGDANNIWIWIGLMAASVVVIAVGATIWAKKHKKK